MTLAITRVNTPSNKISCKCPYSMTPTRIVVHNTANKASAMAEISYMLNNNNEVSYHFAVDGERAVQGLPLNRNGWHAGDGGKGKGNREGIAIEICYSTGTDSQFNASEKNGAKLVALLLKQYGWGIEKVTKHQDYNGKYCPHRTLDKGWQRFINMVKEELGISQPSNSNKKSNEEIAKEVIAGKWGNGSDRKTRLTNAGYDYTAVQSLVNKMLGASTSAPAPKPTKTIDQLADEVIAGKWGNGDDRKKRLTDAGYNYSDVQAKVNQKLGATTPKKSNETIAKEVIAGKWGNGSERKKRLTDAGYNYDAVQSIVNCLCK